METTDTTYGGGTNDDDTSSPSSGSSPAPDMKFINDTHGYYDSIGYYHIVGEVENQGGKNAGFVKVSAIFYHADGTVFDTSFAFAARDVVPVGEKSPFEVFVEDNSAEIADYKLSVSASSISKAPTGAGSLTIQGDSGSWDSIGYYHVVGEALNEGAKKANSVQIVGSLYDSTGQIKRAEFTFADPSDIQPGSTSGFDLFSDAEGEDIASYTLWVEAAGTG